MGVDRDDGWRLTGDRWRRDGCTRTADTGAPSSDVSLIRHRSCVIGAFAGGTRPTADRRQGQDVPGGDAPVAAVGQVDERPAAEVEVVEAAFEPARAGLEADQAAEVLAPLAPGSIERLRAERSSPLVPVVEAADQRAGQLGAVDALAPAEDPERGGRRPEVAGEVVGEGVGVQADP